MRQQLTRHSAVKPTIDQILHAIEETNRVGAEFLKLDLQTAFTFVNLARQMPIDVRKQHHCKAARRAYETVLKLVKKVDLNCEDARAISRLLTQLRSELRGLGETL